MAAIVVGGKAAIVAMAVVVVVSRRYDPRRSYGSEYPYESSR